MNRTMIGSLNPKIQPQCASMHNDGITENNLKQGNKDGTYFFDETNIQVEKPSMRLEIGDIYYQLFQSKYISGIISQGRTCSEQYIKDGYPSIDIIQDVMLNIETVPLLRIETLIAHMPHIPWDEFGEYIILNEQDASTFKMLWDNHLRSIKPLILGAKGNKPQDWMLNFFFRTDYVQ